MFLWHAFIVFRNVILFVVLFFLMITLLTFDLTSSLMLIPEFTSEHPKGAAFRELSQHLLLLSSAG